MSSFDVHEACPHCDDAPPSRQLDAHVARTHADLPPCTARIETEHGETYTCGFRAGHAGGEYGTWHASKCGADMGRYIWNDTAMGATPHRPPEQSDADVLAQFKRMGAVSHTVVATSEVPDSQDTGRRCPRCDCPDGHEQCDHCKVCPHAGPAPEQPMKPRASVIELIAPGYKPTEDSGGSIIVPRHLRINGVSVLTAGPIVISEVQLGENLVTVNIPLVVRRLTIAADGDFQQTEPNKGIPITRAAQAHLGGRPYDYRGTSSDEPSDEETP